MRKISNQAVSEQEVGAWVEEAERGYSDEVLSKRGRKTRGVGPSKVIPVRLTQAEVERLDTYASQWGMTRSDVIRLAIEKLAS
mgnify:CR=1 FL=1